MPYPLHPSITSRLSPQFTSYYNTHLISVPQVHLIPLAQSRALANNVTIDTGLEQPVGHTVDASVPRTLSAGPPIPVRCLVPQGEPPKSGWPTLVYCHGGGWVFDNQNMEKVMATYFCSRVPCIVIWVEYRLAPEDPFPAAVDDAWEASLWLSTKAQTLLPIDNTRLAIGGCSAGANLAAVIAQRASRLPSTGPVFQLQLLLVPVTDNTASTATNSSYAANEHAPGLSVAKMLWFRNHYLPRVEDWAQPEASPLLWEGDWSSLPPAVVVLGGLDPLRDEGERFAARLEGAGVRVKLRVFEAQPHPFLAMDGVLEDGRQGLIWAAEAMRDILYPSSEE
ncbi:hypothetical protein CDD80_1301 [Ophiocordyceps camponoti-rufipedis]|uniref:Alpha/beta hydrolase fold-3 domain-containing protein n=1 Tax=Ophiocordyceps camponoti-rufipedis TaxID=2004952 RepID=A0A2C5XHK8_9HYPO|nr:hypothetical protein CDD80_1301 [Ophiocordyceps camponoti-rufipedis]